jgi:hypothetical protein
MMRIRVLVDVGFGETVYLGYGSALQDLLRRAGGPHGFVQQDNGLSVVGDVLNVVVGTEFRQT